MTINAYATNATTTAPQYQLDQLHHDISYLYAFVLVLNASWSKPAHGTDPFTDTWLGLFRIRARLDMRLL